MDIAKKKKNPLSSDSTSLSPGWGRSLGWEQAEEGKGGWIRKSISAWELRKERGHVNGFLSGIIKPGQKGRLGRANHINTSRWHLCLAELVFAFCLDFFFFKITERENWKLIGLLSYHQGPNLWKRNEVKIIGRKSVSWLLTPPSFWQGRGRSFWSGREYSQLWNP